MVLRKLPRKIYSVESPRLIFQDAEELEFALPAVVEEQAKLLVSLSVTDPEEQVKQLQSWKGVLIIQIRDIRADFSWD